MQPTRGDGVAGSAGGVGVKGFGPEEAEKPRENKEAETEGLGEKEGVSGRTWGAVWEAVVLNAWLCLCPVERGTWVWDCTRHPGHPGQEGWQPTLGHPEESRVSGHRRQQSGQFAQCFVVSRLVAFWSDGHNSYPISQPRGDFQWGGHLARNVPALPCAHTHGGNVLSHQLASEGGAGDLSP